MARPHWANAGGAVIPTVTSVATAVKMLVQRNRMGWFSLGIGLPSQANHVSCVRTVTHFTDLYFRQSWTICSSRRRSAIVSNLSAGPLPLVRNEFRLSDGGGSPACTADGGEARPGNRRSICAPDISERFRLACIGSKFPQDGQTEPRRYRRQGDRGNV